MYRKMGGRGRERGKGKEKGERRDGDVDGEGDGERKGEGGSGGEVGGDENRAIDLFYSISPRGIAIVAQILPLPCKRYAFPYVH
jgi:hypothetical protein